MRNSSSSKRGRGRLLLKLYLDVFGSDSSGPIQAVEI